MEGLNSGRALVAAALVCLALWWPTLASGSPDDLPVRVTVRAAATDAAVEGAIVSVAGDAAPVRTGPDGVAILARLPGGRRVAVRVVADGFHPVETILETGRVPAQLTVLLNPAILRLDEAVIVAASRAERLEATTPRSTTIIGQATLDERVARTAPEALQDQSGGWVQKTNHGGGSPFVRGLVGNQVLVLIDGVRLNNATFRLGPNQYMNTIDAYGLERIEILRGSGSVAYGSDALGGVVNVVTPRPVLSAGKVLAGGSVATRLAGHGMEASIRADGFVSGRRLAARGGVTYRAFGDLVAGGDLGTEAPSAYEEADVDASVLWQPARRTRVTALFQNVHQFDVPRFDQVAQRGYAVYNFDPQIRRLGYVELDQRFDTSWLDTLKVTASWHRSEEGRVRRRTSSVIETREEDVVSTAGLAADVGGRVAPWLAWQGGVEVYDDIVRSCRRDTNLSTGTSVPMRGLYPDGSTRRSVAGFVMATVATGRWAVDAGARYTRDDVRADDPVFGPTALAPDAVVGSVAARVAITPWASAFGSVAQAFRAPNIDDLSTLGAFDFGVEVPPEGLKPERSLAFEGGVKVAASRVTAAVTAYRMDLEDLIERERTTFNGSPTLDGQFVYHRANIGAALVRGIEADLEWRAASPLTLFGFIATTLGELKDGGTPLRRIPPANGLLGARYRGGRGWWAEAAVRAARTQDRLAPGDVADHRIPPGGTPGWVVVNLSGGLPVWRGIGVTGGLANVFNEAYRIHGSGVDGPGRHVWLSARLSF
jgi:outer membrane receptor protein involved in Fe transport